MFIGNESEVPYHINVYVILHEVRPDLKSYLNGIFQYLQIAIMLIACSFINSALKLCLILSSSVLFIYLIQ